MTQHTPGPWHVDLGHVSREHLKGRIQVAVWDEHEACIAACMDSDENARLIAAAPDLLDALRDALEAVKTFHGPDAWDIYWTQSPEMKRARGAIAKATGSAS